MVQGEVDLLGLEDVRIPGNVNASSSYHRDNDLVPIPFESALVPISESRIGHWTLSPNQTSTLTQASQSQDILMQYDGRAGYRHHIDNKGNAAESFNKEQETPSNSFTPTTQANTRLSQYLGNQSFSPPPTMPTNLGVSNFDFVSLGTRREDKMDLPQIEKVLHSGRILGRISLKSLVMKNWKELFWIVYGHSQIIFFRCKEDYFEWVLNPYLGPTQRDQLVKLSIDFERDISPTGIKGYQCTVLKKKNYRCGDLHQFKVDSMTSFGPSLVAAFGSRSREDSLQLHIILKELMKQGQELRRGKL
jgi:hypothetical protein